MQTDKPLLTLAAVKLASTFRASVEVRDKYADNLSRWQELDERRKIAEANAKANPIAWALLTAINSDELSAVLTSVRGQYRYEPTRGGMRCRHYIKTGDRYARKAGFFYGMTKEDAAKPENNPVVYRRSLKRIEAKLRKALP